MAHKLVSSLAVAGLLFTLVGCSSSGESQSGEADCVVTESGSASDGVEVTGGGDDALEATFPQPTSADETQRSVVTAGDAEGMVAVDGTTVTASVAVYNGTSGTQIEELTATQDFVLEDPLFPGIQDAFRCSVPGDIVAAVIPPADGFGEEGVPQVELAATDSLVFVAEVTDVAESPEVLPRADGVDQPVTPGLPTVTLAEDGAPTITVPDTEPPAELQIAVLKQGDGAEVPDGASVTVHYTGVVWDSGEIFDSSWAKGTPATFSTDQVISGFSAALVGQKVGSQVIAVIPPADGYGDTPPGDPITATSTLVFVVDILAVQ